MRELTLHERIRNADASQQVENVKAKHAYLHGRADATGEWGVIWSRSDDCSWAHAFGRMRGFDQVYHGSVGDYDRMCMENMLDLMEVYPEVQLFVRHLLLNYFGTFVRIPGAQNI